MNREPEKSAVLTIGGFLWRLATRRLTVSITIALAGAFGWHWLTDSSPRSARATTLATTKQPLKADDLAKWVETNPVTPLTKKSQAAKPAPAKTLAAKPPAPKPAAKTVSRPTPPATRPALAKRPTAPTPPAPALGPLYIDDVHGFSMRFPASWIIHTFEGEPWVLDCGDTRVGLISIGFSPCPEEIKAESLMPEAIARRIKKRSRTTLHGQGRAEISGKSAVWSKSTGPLPMTHAAPRMTRVQYVVPLQDGRALELRLAAPPEKFEALASLMKKSLETFRVTPKAQPTAQAASAQLR